MVFNLKIPRGRMAVVLIKTDPSKMSSEEFCKISQISYSTEQQRTFSSITNSVCGPILVDISVLFLHGCPRKK